MIPVPTTKTLSERSNYFMKLTLIFNEQISSIDATNDLEIETLKMVAQAELGIEDFTLIFNNQPLLSGTVQSNNIGDNDVIIVHKQQPTPVPNAQNAQLQQLLSNPQLMQQFQQMLQNGQNPQAQLPQQVSNPIQDNLEYTIEHYPEAFGSVCMLYISCQVNKVPIKCFVDSGAQATIISLDMAKRCELDHLIDKRFGGEARGVGTGKILGRIHAAELRIGDLFLTCTLTVMETLGMDMLFGLDMLRRHQVVLDLNKNVLKIQNKEFTFLPEHEIPKGMFNPEKSPVNTPNKELKRQTEQTSLPTVNNGNSLGQQPQPNAQVNEAAIKQLIDLGAKNRHHALQLLSKANGNLEIATSLLFQ